MVNRNPFGSQETPRRSEVVGELPSIWAACMVISNQARMATREVEIPQGVQQAIVAACDGSICVSDHQLPARTSRSLESFQPSRDLGFRI